MKLNKFTTFSLLALLVAGAQALAANTPVDKSWEEMSDDDGITTWRKEVEGSPVVAFRGEAVIEAPIAKVFNVLYDTSRKTEWVAKIVEAKDLRQITETERVEYNHTSAPWPIKDRDFVFSAKVEADKTAKQVFIKLKSVEEKVMPENEDVAVRGQLMNSAYTLTSIEGGKKTNLVVEILADPKGSIPKWVVNLFQKGWPRKTLEGIRRQVAKPDVTEHQKIKAFFEGA